MPYVTWTEDVNGDTEVLFTGTSRACGCCGFVGMSFPPIVVSC